MAARAGGLKLNSLLMGVCLPSLKENASKFRVQYLEFDPRLLAYFKHHFMLFASDPQKICKSGDVVLLQRLKREAADSVTHQVVRVIYPCGDVTDPVTKKKVAGVKYRDEIERTVADFGELESTFKYREAPRRGWQEDKKDFTHRESYIKYHKFPEGDENEHQPYSTPF